MRTLSLLCCAAVVAIPSYACSDTLWMSSGGDNPKESISFATVGTDFQPGTVSATGTVGSGQTFTTVTIGDIDGDGFPDIMATLQAAAAGTETPGTIIIGDDSPSGKTLWSVEVDRVMLHKIHMSPTSKIGQPGGGVCSVTFVSPLPPNGQLGTYLRKKLPGKMKSGQIVIAKIQDPPGQTDISESELVFPAALAPPNPAADPYDSLPFFGPLHFSITTPGNLDDGYPEWMNSVIQNGTDIRPVALTYTFDDGSSLEFDFSLGLSSLTYSTEGPKVATGGPSKFYRLVFRP